VQVRFGRGPEPRLVAHRVATAPKGLGPTCTAVTQSTPGGCGGVEVVLSVLRVRRDNGGRDRGQRRLVEASGRAAEVVQQTVLEECWKPAFAPLPHPQVHGAICGRMSASKLTFSSPTVF